MLLDQPCKDRRGGNNYPKYVYLTVGSRCYMHSWNLRRNIFNGHVNITFFLYTAIGFNVETVSYKNLKFQGAILSSVDLMTTVMKSDPTPFSLISN